MIKSLSFLFLIFITLSSSVFAQEVNDNIKSSPEEVTIGVYVLNLGKFDIATGSFTIDFYLSMKCQTECSIADLEFNNGRSTTIDTLIDEPNEKFYRIQANLNSPVALYKFPFDNQQLSIILEDKTRTIEEVIYVPSHDETGIEPSIVFAGWNIDGWLVQANEHYYSVYDETYSQYIYTISISRIALNSFLKTFLPVFFILIVVLCTFLIDPDKVAQRITMVSSSLVAAVMFHVSINNQIPPVGYLTFADKFMILTYFILLLSFIIAIALLELQEQKKSLLVEKLHKITEYLMFLIVPLLYILLFYLLL